MKKLLSVFTSLCLAVGILAGTPAIKADAASVPSNANLLNTYGNVFDYVGTALVADEILNSNILNMASKEYNSITVGNEMKPDYVLRSWSQKIISVNEAKAKGYYIPAGYSESTVPELDYSTVDKVMKACYEKGLKMRGHTLLWHSQTPDWFFRAGYNKNNNYVDKNTMKLREQYFIRNYLGHCCDSQYGSIIYAWDVVNEYIHAPQNASGWQKIYGNTSGSPVSYVKDAFECAYDTLKDHNKVNQIHLFYNDFNTYMDVDKTVNLVKYINSDRKICAGVGMQSHLSTDYPSVSYYKAALSRFCKEGFEVQITELDAGCTNDQTQAQYYYDLMRAILDCKKQGGNITAIVWWGMTDKTSWRSKNRPLLYSDYNQPKAAYNSVLQAYFDAGYTTVGYNGPSGNQPSNPQPSNPQPSTPTTGSYAKLTDGYYYIKGVGSQKYLQVANNTGKNVQNVEIGTGTGVDGQVWKLTNTSDGYFTLTSKLGNFGLDIANGSSENGANVQIYASHTGDAQQFAVIAGQNNAYTIVTKCSSGQKVLDVEGRKTADGTNVCQYTNNGQTNQLWNFEVVGGSSTGNQGNTQPANPEPTNPQPSNPEPTNPTSNTGVSISYKTANDWNSGFQGEITITNNSSSTINGWTLTFDCSSKIGNTWGGELVGTTGTTVTVKNPAWATTLAPKASVTIGFVAEGSNKPSNFKVNGVASSESTTPGQVEPQPQPEPTPEPDPQPEPQPEPQPTTGTIISPSQVTINKSTPSSATQLKGNVNYGTAKVETYYSNITNSQRSYVIYLPAGYSTAKKYPVIYMLHGIGGNHLAFGTNPQSSTLMKMAANLAASGEAKECIIVFPHIRVSNTAETNIMSNQNFGYYDAFREELINNLMPHINSKYSTATGRENTAVAGFSMGGRESLYIGVSKADLFGYTAAFCPAPGCLPNTMNGVTEAGLFPNGMGIADPYKNNSLVMIVKGQNDYVVSDQPLQYTNALTKSGTPHVYYDMPGGHEESVYGNGFYNFLRYVFK